MHLDVKKCKNNHHCGTPQQRALSAVQLKFDEAAWAKRALALQVQVQPIGHGEIIVVMNDDPEDGVQEPFFIGEAAVLYDTKAGKIGITYIWVLGDQETLFGKLYNNDAVLDTLSSTSRPRLARTYMRGLQRGSRCTLKAFASAMFDWRRYATR
jgi:hypothetical protein